MYQTYKGYFKDGRFMSSESVVIPDNTEVYVMVVGDNLTTEKPKSQQQLEAFNRFVKNIKSIDDEPLTDEDFAGLDNKRINFWKENRL